MQNDETTRRHTHAISSDDFPSPKRQRGVSPASSQASPPTESQTPERQTQFVETNPATRSAPTYTSVAHGVPGDTHASPPTERQNPTRPGRETQFVETNPATRSVAAPARIAANRENAQKSTGPRTEEGKSRSSRNATRHGLYARDVIVTKGDFPEDAEDFERLKQDLIEEFNPAGPLEQTLVERLAVSFWRLRRAYRFEVRAIGVCREHHLSWSKTSPANYKAFEARPRDEPLPLKQDVDTLVRYESMIDREIHRTLNQLQSFRKNAQRSPNPTTPTDAEPRESVTPPSPSESPALAAKRNDPFPPPRPSHRVRSTVDEGVPSPKRQRGVSAAPPSARANLLTITEPQALRPKGARPLPVTSITGPKPFPFAFPAQRADETLSRPMDAGLVKQAEGNGRLFGKAARLHSRFGPALGQAGRVSRTWPGG